MAYTPTQRLVAARDCIHSARGELLDAVAADGTVTKRMAGARDRAAYRLQLAAWHLSRLSA